jgi:hypothetical protein
LPVFGLRHIRSSGHVAENPSEEASSNFTANSRVTHPVIVSVEPSSRMMISSGGSVCARSARRHCGSTSRSFRAQISTVSVGRERTKIASSGSRLRACRDTTNWLETTMKPSSSESYEI